jgi:hypothetical protein
MQPVWKCQKLFVHTAVNEKPAHRARRHEHAELYRLRNRGPSVSEQLPQFGYTDRHCDLMSTARHIKQVMGVSLDVRRIRSTLQQPLHRRCTCVSRPQRAFSVKHKARITGLVIT